MAKKKVQEKDKPMNERWKDYGIAYLKFLIQFIIWVLVGGMALWALQNKTSETSLPFDMTKLPYENSGKVSASSQINSFADIPLFSYKPPVGFPYNFKDPNESTWAEGFGNWFSRTESGSWGFGRKILFEIGRLFSIGFLVLSKIPKIPGISMDYYNIAELICIFLLPILVIFGIIFQPITTTLTTLGSSFYDNSWFWGIIGLCFPVWIMNFFNILLQNIYLGIFLFLMPLTSGGFTKLRKTVFKNKMMFLWMILIGAVVISTGYLPSQITVGMTLGLIMLMAWHYFFGPIASQALSKVIKSTTSSSNNASNSTSNSNNASNSTSNSNNASNSTSNSNNASGSASSSNSEKMPLLKKRKIKMNNVPPDAIGKIFEKFNLS